VACSTFEYFQEFQAFLDNVLTFTPAYAWLVFFSKQIHVLRPSTPEALAWR
jgi:hypothetical protein